jgi:Tol biopolymer transport system component
MKWKSAVSPDGEWIAFSHLHEKGLFLQTVRRDGRDQQLLQPGVTDRFSGAFHAAWSPDGTHLAATFITAEGGHHMGLARMDAESGVALDIRLLDTLGSMASRPAWSPDGRWLAYETVSDHSWDIWIADANGQSPRRLTEFPGNERGPIWSHDGRWLFFKHEARSIWRLPMNSDGKAEGGAAPWLTIPSTVIDDDGLALNKETAVVSIGTESSGIWLVEFP